MGIKWSNYIIGHGFLDNKIRMVRGKETPKGYFLSNDKSHDVTDQAVRAVAYHMRSLMEDGHEGSEIVFQDGSRLIFKEGAE